MIFFILFYFLYSVVFAKELILPSRLSVFKIVSLTLVFNSVIFMLSNILWSQKRYQL